ncbi:Pycsar system effector family protein [Streptomyces sp. NPDC000931]|uniref:Pycsar system effector family protein n=1 Tax=Streptomyces sp. NPDC000931 TaxID=3154372 RepID=UPI00332EA544
MPEASQSSSVSSSSLVPQRLEMKVGEMFLEVQRADVKATTLCGVAGGLLAVDAAALSVLGRASCLPTASLVCAAALLGLALVVALSAIRPVLPGGGGTAVVGAFAVGCSRPEEILSAFRSMSAEEHLQAEAERLALLAVLAQRKFRAVKRSVDLTAAAAIVAGIGLLSIYITA